MTWKQLKIYLMGLLTVLGFSVLGHGEEPPNQKVRSPEKKEIKIVVLGDSLAVGYGVAKEKAYPAQLEVLLRKKGYLVTITNAGISGSTTASAVSRLKWQLRNPINILVLELGGNDGLRGLAITATKKNLADTIKLAKTHHLKVLLTGMKLPTNYGDKYRRNFSSMYKELAQEHKVIFMPFLLQDIGGKEGLNIGDGIHPNEIGQLKIAENLLPFIEKLL